MVHFEERFDGDDRYLRITEETSTDVNELPLYDSLVKGLAKPWPPLTGVSAINWCIPKDFGYGTVQVCQILKTSHHSLSTAGAPSQTLGNRIAAKETYWGENLTIPGEVQYMTGYWEWTEDILSRSEEVLEQVKIYDAVYASLFTYDSIPDITRAFCESWSPSTNTLVTKAGELSISLWDLHRLGGLPIVGELFDEVVPSPRELTDYTEDMERHLPASCGQLLLAYHLIYHKKRDEKVLISDWIKYWCHIPESHAPPPATRKIVKSRRLTRTHNPTGELPRPEKWGSKNRTTFDTLGVSNDQREEVYLAAFISCWLCHFVLPTKSVGQIRPGVFKMACFMAKGVRVGLAIPVLSSIYRGLNVIARSGIPS